MLTLCFMTRLPMAQKSASGGEEVSPRMYSNKVLTYQAIPSAHEAAFIFFRPGWPTAACNCFKNSK